MGPEDFEELLAAATRQARAELGADARVVLQGLTLYLDLPRLMEATPRVTYVARSEAAQKRMRIEFSGSAENVAVQTTSLEGYRHPKDPAERPWLVDPTLVELVHSAWRRVAPLHGQLTVDVVRKPYGGTSQWILIVLHASGPRGGEAQSFQLSGGSLIELGKK